MREHWARTIAIVTGALVILASAGFALIQNPPAHAADPEASVVESASEHASVSAADLARGRELFDSLDCSRCHSIAGHGNPRSPLDFSAAEMDSDTLRAFIIGDDSVADQLAPRTLAAKQPYADEPIEDIDALLVLLQNLDTLEN